MAICNKYKAIFKDFANNLDIKSLNKLRLVDKWSRNIMPGFENPAIELKLNKILSNRFKQ